MDALDVLSGLSFDDEERTWLLTCKRCGAVVRPPRTKVVPAGRRKALRFAVDDSPTEVGREYWQELRILVMDGGEFPRAVRDIVDAFAEKGYEVGEITLRIAKVRKKSKK